ncbi:coiled-coil domain-containing protein 106 isoform X2 [Nothobranchius furzeri]|uniref:coiled-coil domain-containing protein 106 isoform X2 n=1 Tax=Nothobranchius furzeri TaxID=105023 RepID=UPI002403DFE4|nr:coiled-coil domain-containing protein 106-like isoform X2 [Nothobranchius furzeri]
MPPKRVRKASQTRAWVTTFHANEESGTEKATSSQKGILKKDTPSEKDSEDTRSLSSDTTQCSSVSSECSSPLSSDDDKKKKRKTKKRLKKEKGKTSKKIKDKDYQRAQSPNQVVSRYQSLLKLYRKGGTMARAFKRYGVDRNTIVITAPIAELSIAAPRKYAEVLQNYSTQVKLSVFAAHCAFAIAEDPEVKQLVKDYKTNGKLLPFKIK